MPTARTSGSLLLGGMDSRRQALSRIWRRRQSASPRAMHRRRSGFLSHSSRSPATTANFAREQSRWCRCRSFPGRCLNPPGRCSKPPGLVNPFRCTVTSDQGPGARGGIGGPAIMIRHSKAARWQVAGCTGMTAELRAALPAHSRRRAGSVASCCCEGPRAALARPHGGCAISLIARLRQLGLST